MPPQKCFVAIYTRNGRSTDYKVLTCRREVAVAGYGPLSVLSLAECRFAQMAGAFSENMAGGTCVLAHGLGGEDCGKIVDI